MAIDWAEATKVLVHLSFREELVIPSSWSDRYLEVDPTASNKIFIVPNPPQGTLDDALCNGKIDWDLLVKLSDQLKFGMEEVVTRVDWNEKYFDSNFVAKNKTSTVPNLQRAIPAGKAFLRLYVDGTAPANTVDMFRVIFLNMRLVDGTSLMTDHLYGQSGSPELVFPPAANKFQSATNDRTSRFNDFIWNLLNHHLPAEQQLGINILGFLLFVCIRLCVKNSKHVAYYIRNSAKGKFVSLFGRQDGLPDFVPPCPEASAQIIRSFKRLSSNCIKVLTDYVSSYVRSESKTVQSILCEGCLSILRLKGLGIVDFLQSAEIKTGLSAVTLMSYMDVPRHAKTNKAIIQLLANFVKPYQNRTSWPWARLFAGGAFFDLRTKADLLYALTMFAIANDASDDGDLWSRFDNVHSVTVHKREAIMLARNILSLEEKK